MVRIFSLNGNIGSGKSTLLEGIGRALGSRGVSVKVIPEPIDEWCLPVLRGGTCSMLGAFYEDQQSNAFAFQMYVLCTRLEQLRAELRDLPEDSVVVIERGPWVDCDCMGVAIHRTGGLTEMQWSVYRRWSEMMVRALPELSGLIYLRTTPDQCVTRIQSRGRSTELSGIDLSYLSAIHEAHEQFLRGESSPPVFLVNSWTGRSGEAASSVADWIESFS